MADPTDAELLAACIDGNRRAWNTFVQRFTRYVYYLVQLTGRRYSASMTEEQVADLHNDVFVSLMEDDCRRLRAFEGKNGCSVRSWIRIITIRKAVDHLRRRRHHISLDADEGETLGAALTEEGPDALDALLAQEAAQRRAQLTTLAEKLNEKDRLLLHLLFDEKLSAEAAAAVLKVSKGALYTRKTRLIQRLREEARRANLLDGV